jgi:four helix bundle protein
MKNQSFPFQKLEVWHESKDLCLSIYLISNGFPTNEQFGLTNQIRGAALSIPTNLAEGSSRITRKEQARYTEIAFGSLMEVANLLIIAKELNYINEISVEPILDKIATLGKRLSTLRNSQNRVK